MDERRGRSDYPIESFSSALGHFREQADAASLELESALFEDIRQKGAGREPIALAQFPIQPRQINVNPIMLRQLGRRRRRQPRPGEQGIVESPRLAVG